MNKISKLIESLPGDAWIRTCQECGHTQQEANNPTIGKMQVEGLTDSYRERKCRKCKSPALDYGTNNASVLDWTDDEFDNARTETEIIRERYERL